jgi:flagellin
MRKQIRGLDQASTNAEDGVSAVQTAEGALTEVHSMLQRMNELAVQAANGTNSVSDRDAIQAEIKQLTTEIDRVAETTKFNETYLLKGSSGTTTEYIEGRDAGLDYQTFVDGESVATMKIDLSAGKSVTVGGQVYNIIRSDGKDELETIQKAIAAGAGTVIVNGTTYTKGEDAEGNTIYDAGTGSTYQAGELAAKIQDGTSVTIDGATYIARDYNSSSNKKAEDVSDLIITALEQANNIGVTKTEYNSSAKFIERTGDGTDDKDVFKYEITKGQKDVDNALTFNLHVGADADMTNKITVNIDTMNAAGLGIKDLNVSDDSGIAATYAIDVIADAISTVSAQRSALGAVQNRLEHTINNLDNVVENTTSAESRIRDTDMAEEMVEYSKNNILAQAGQSMLAQANQSTQGVLSLLQG